MITEHDQSDSDSSASDQSIPESAHGQTDKLRLFRALTKDSRKAGRTLPDDIEREMLERKNTIQPK